jgi:regulator of cell morphogenesis and NO signaling
MHASQPPSDTPATPLAARPVGEIVAEDYGRAAVLRRHGIGFCCGGGTPLADACTRKGIPLATVEAEIAAHDARMSTLGEDAPVQDSPSDPAVLVDHIESVHHAWVRENLAPLLHFTGRVAKVHGDGWPELHEVADRTRHFAQTLTTHMDEEETHLFPAIREGGAGLAQGGADIATLSVLEEEHEVARSLLSELRELTSDFTPPPHACATWRAAYAKLMEFELDLDRHLHLENNVLFPQLRARAAAS